MNFLVRDTRQQKHKIYFSRNYNVASKFTLKTFLIIKCQHKVSNNFQSLSEDSLLYTLCLKKCD